MVVRQKRRRVVRCPRIFEEKYFHLRIVPYSWITFFLFYVNIDPSCFERFLYQSPRITSKVTTLRQNFPKIFNDTFDNFDGNFRYSNVSLEIRFDSYPFGTFPFFRISSYYPVNFDKF